MPRRFAPRQSLTILQKVKIGGVFWTMFELSLNKILNKSVRFRSPPLRFGETKTDKFSLHFLIFSHTIFSFKRKRKFICFVFLLIREKRKRSNSNRKRAKRKGAWGKEFLPFCLFTFWFRILVFLIFLYNIGLKGSAISSKRFSSWNRAENFFRAEIEFGCSEVQPNETL